MLRALTIVLLSCLSCACADEALAPLPGPVELPTVSILGDEPPRAGRVDITITSLGDLYVGTTKTTLVAMLPLLLAASGGAVSAIDHADECEEVFEEIEITAEEPVEETEDVAPIPAPTYTRVLAARDEGIFEADGSRAADALLRFDRDVPWSVVSQVLQQCAHPDAKLYRCFVSVRDETTKARGAIGVFLLKDTGLGCGTGPGGGESYDIRLGFKTEGAWPADAHDCGALIDAMRRMQPTPETPIQVILSASPLASWSSVVRVVDAALRAKVWNFAFEGRVPKEQATIAERMAASRRAGPFGVVIRKPPRVDQALGRRPPGGRLSGTIGFAGDGSYFDREDEEEVIEDDLPEPSGGARASEGK